MDNQSYLTNDLTANQRKIISAVSKYRVISRARISELTGLTPSAVTQLSKSLINLGLLREGSRQKCGRGQPPIPLEINPEGAFSLGVSIEPNFIAISISNLSGLIVHHESTPVDNHQSLDEMIELIQTLVSTGIVKAKIPKAKVLGIGFSLAGYRGAKQNWVCVPSLQCLNDVDLVSILNDAFDYPVYIENNVNASVIGEYYSHIKKDFSTIVFIDIGFGIGAGIIYDGVLFKGGFNNAGQVGLSFPYGKERPSYLDFVSRKELSLEQWITRSAVQIEQILSSCIQWIDPQLIILGGSLPKDVADKLIDILSLRIGSLVPVDANSPKLILSPNGERSSTLGASIIPFYNEFYL
ncbi:ROK family transcriptional regulator [Vibrio sinensis]|uniref:ROK family transcriptional regulator n=1 Tax=Vibrio sinensis TaxID=2302434 RepID=A0A3A6QUD9_9VIBR|nr:ROK family protein [Vibrio sinensis]RJX71969.1 ROK family transcriptional regulator [Vibrio sinensis]